MLPFAEGNTSDCRQGHTPTHPPRVFPTEDTDTLDRTGVGYDLPVAVITSPPSWYNHLSSASASAAAGSATHMYDLGCGWGL